MTKPNPDGPGYLTRNEGLQKGVARATHTVRMAEKSNERKRAAPAEDIQAAPGCAARQRAAHYAGSLGRISAGGGLL